MSALKLSKDLGFQYKTAFVLCHKIRSSIEKAVSSLVLSGQVEVDGSTLGGYTKYMNYASLQYGKRKCSKHTAHRRVVVVAKQRNGRTAPFVTHREPDATEDVVARLDDSAVVVCDEARAWDGLSSMVENMRVNHDVCYDDGEGACTNNAESYFSGLRAVKSTHGVMSPQYLLEYASELAWKRDFAKHPHSDRVMMILSLCLCEPAPRRWRGYWQRRRLKELAAERALETA